MSCKIPVKIEVFYYCYRNYDNVSGTFSAASMNLIDGFLFDSTHENKDDAKVVMKSILKAVFNKDFIIDDVTSQKSYQAIGTSYHGIRFDAYILRSREIIPRLWYNFTGAQDG